MSFEFIEVERDGRLLQVTLKRPERMNALHPPAHRELDGVFEEFQNDPDLWVALVTGSGDRAFCAGNDLRYQAEKGAEAVRAGMAGVRGGFAGLVRRFDLFKPLVAAVNGVALGGGFEIALACDIILASDNATFGLPEPRVGLMAAAGGVHRLPRHIPHHLAMGMMLTGRHISASEAHSLGIVNQVVPAGDLLSAARRWVDQILECAPLSVRASKEAALRGRSLPLEQAMTVVFPESARMMASDDFVEGPRAFAEKRKPDWRGH